jgi:hypothetical protein
MHNLRRTGPRRSRMRSASPGSEPTRRIGSASAASSVESKSSSGRPARTRAAAMSDGHGNTAKRAQARPDLDPARCPGATIEEDGSEPALSKRAYPTIPPLETGDVWQPGRIRSPSRTGIFQACETAAAVIPGRAPAMPSRVTGAGRPVVCPAATTTTAPARNSVTNASRGQQPCRILGRGYGDRSMLQPHYLPRSNG